MSHLKKGCRNAVETCMDVSKGEKILIVSDGNSKKVGQTIKKIANEITPQIRFFNLDIYGDRPLNKLPKVIEQAATDANVTFWTARSVDGELESVRMPFFKAAVNGGRHAHMLNITEEVVERGLSGDYHKIEQFTNKICDMARSASKVRIKTEKGTDLTAHVGKYKWVSSTGIITDIGKWHNLPDGEIFTTPYKMEGKAVIDGTLGDYFDQEYDLSVTQETPVEVKIENKERPRVTDIKCENQEIEERLNEYVDRNPCSRDIGELGIGTNLFIDELIGNMLMDEKYPSAHIAPGDPNNNMTFAGWSCPTHLDLIIRDTDIWFDDNKIMEKGEYLID